MRKITIIFGGTPSWYFFSFKLFKYLKKKFGMEIPSDKEIRTLFMKKGKYRFTTKIKNTKINVFFCMMPKKDKNYNKMKEFHKKQWNEKLPPTAEDVCKQISEKTSVILFFGVAGAFSGKLNQIYLPTKFKQINFKTDVIKKDNIKRFKIKKQITRKNILTEKIKGNDSIVITSNLMLIPEKMENKSKCLLKKIASRLKKFGGLVEMESYQIAKGINKNIPLGLFLMTSDALSENKHMLERGKIKFNIDKFNKTCYNVIQKFAD